MAGGFALAQHLSLLELLLKDALKGVSVGSELADTLAELVHGHGVLVEVEAEEGLVLEVSFLLNVERACVRGIELLGDGLGAVVELLKESGLGWVSKS